MTYFYKFDLLRNVGNLCGGVVERLIQRIANPCTEKLVPWVRIPVPPPSSLSIFVLSDILCFVYSFNKIIDIIINYVYFILMKKIFSIFASSVLTGFCACFILRFFNFILLSLWNFNIFSCKYWGFSYVITESKLNMNKVYGFSFISLLIGLLLVFISIVPLMFFYFNDKFHNCTFLKNLYSNKKHRDFIKSNNYSTHNVSKNINKKMNQNSGKKVLPSDTGSIKEISKDVSVNTNNINEIPLPKSIVNSDAYAVVQKLKNNNVDPLVFKEDASNVDDVKTDDESQDSGSDVKKNELRKRILKKFNTSLNDMKNKNNVS